MAKNGKTHGKEVRLFSARQERITGFLDYANPEGDIVRITQRDPDLDLHKKCAWDDMVPLGEVIGDPLGRSSYGMYAEFYSPLEADWGNSFSEVSTSDVVQFNDKTGSGKGRRAAKETIEEFDALSPEEQEAERNGVMAGLNASNETQGISEELRLKIKSLREKTEKLQFRPLEEAYNPFAAQNEPASRLEADEQELK